MKLTPEEMAERIIGTTDSVTAKNLRAMVAEAIEKDRDMRGDIEPPTGLPFDVVSTKAAQATIDWLCSPAADRCCEADGSLAEFNRMYDRVRHVLAHRDHLAQQVTEAQAAATSEQTARRNTDARLRGAMAWVVGDASDSNPYVREEYEGAWEAWAAGWHDAERADYMSTHRSLHTAMAAGAMAAADGSSVDYCPYPGGPMREAWLRTYGAVQAAKGRMFEKGIETANGTATRKP